MLTTAWYSDAIRFGFIDDAVGMSCSMLIDIFFMLPLTWLVAGFPLPSYETPNAQAIAAIAFISAGLGVVFIGNGLLIGSWIDRLLPNFGKLRKETNRKGNTTANKANSSSGG